MSYVALVFQLDSGLAAEILIGPVESGEGLLPGVAACPDKLPARE